MRLTSYERFRKEELILRDHLAVDRTILASERTFLAYSRTALTMCITGLSLIKFFNSIYAQLFGWVFIIFSSLIFIWGGIRFGKFRKNIHNVSKRKLNQ